MWNTGNLDANNEDIDSKNGTVDLSPFIGLDLVVDAKQTPGIVLFENYETVKQRVIDGVSFYADFQYSLDNYKVALDHYYELKYVKDILEKAKRQIKKSYNQPLEIVENQLDELIELIKKPFKKVDTFIKQNEKEAKKHSIYIFAKKYALSLGLHDHIAQILNSPAFFDQRWLNATCRQSIWTNEVTKKLVAAHNDIQQILEAKNENTPSILAHYYQTLSLKQTMDFLDSLMLAKTVTTENNETVADNNETVNDSKKQTIEEPSANVSKPSLDKTDTQNNRPLLTDYEVLKSVAKSINPFTGEVIVGIDEDLRNRLMMIASKII